MTFTGADASGGDGWFPQHPKTGDFETLKGSMLQPVTQEPMTSTAGGDSRHIASAGGTDWTGTILVNTGMTRGTGTNG